MIPFRRVALIAWLGAAVSSFFIDATTAASFPNLCLFRFWWGHACPGCGMGRALLCAFQGEWRQSVHYHPLGIPFLLVWTGWLIFDYASLVKRKMSSKMPSTA